MSNNQPIGANTQIGTLNGLTEGYSKIDELAGALKPLLTDGIISSGSAIPTAVPVDGVPPFYVRTGTTPDTLYWWNPLPVPGAWALIGSVPDALLAAAEWPLALPADANRPASGEFVVAAIAALKALLDPCTVTAATAAEIAAMTADPSLMRAAVCFMDATPTPVGLTGVQLAAILAGSGGGPAAAAGLLGALASGDIVSAIGPYPGGASDRWLVIALLNNFGQSDGTTTTGSWPVPPVVGFNVPGSASSLPWLYAGVATGGAALVVASGSGSSGGVSGFAIRLAS